MNKLNFFLAKRKIRKRIKRMEPVIQWFKAHGIDPFVDLGLDEYKNDNIEKMKPYEVVEGIE